MYHWSPAKVALIGVPSSRAHPWGLQNCALTRESRFEVFGVIHLMNCPQPRFLWSWWMYLDWRTSAQAVEEPQTRCHFSEQPQNLLALDFFEVFEVHHTILTGCFWAWFTQKKQKTNGCKLWSKVYINRDWRTGSLPPSRFKTMHTKKENSWKQFQKSAKKNGSRMFSLLVVQACSS